MPVTVARSRAARPGMRCRVARRASADHTLSSPQPSRASTRASSESGTGAIVATSVSTFTCCTASVRNPDRSTSSRPYACDTDGAYPVVRNALAGLPRSRWPNASRIAVSATTA
jgi:hypothetical protein